MTSEAQVAANRARSLKIAAGRVGCTVEEYQQWRADGWSWCSPHGEWHPVEAFSRGKKGRVIATACRVARNEERRVRAQAQLAEKRAREGVPPRQELKVEVDEPRWPVWALRTAVGQLWFFGEKACIGLDPELFFPEHEGGLDEEKVREAKRVCFRCPSADLCLTAALGRGEAAGIWGGFTTDERDEIVGRRSPAWAS